MQPAPSVAVECDVPAAMRDGVMLRADVYRPAGEGSCPVLLTRTPYGKDVISSELVLAPVPAARRGYVVVVQDVRGTGASDGDLDLYQHEANDGADSVAWAAALPGADGRVGLFGASYLGSTQWLAVLCQPPALRAIAPAITPTDPLNGMIYRGGALELGVGAYATLGAHLAVLVRRRASDATARRQAIAAWAAEADALGTSGYWSLPLRTFAPLQRQDAGEAFGEALAAPMDRTQSPAALAAVHGQYDRVQVPTYHIGGWYDLHLGDTLAGFVAQRAQGTPTKLLVGPWSHLRQTNPVGEMNFGTGAQAGFLDLETDVRTLQLRWFDHWLKGIDAGLMAEAPVRIFVMGANISRDEDEWPPARAVSTPCYLRAGGSLSLDPPGDEAPDHYAYDPADPVPTRGGGTLLPPEYPAGPYDQRPIEGRPDILIYRSQPLARDTEVTGPIVVHLWAVSLAPDTDFVARLVDIAPDGRSLNLADGIVRARYRDFAAGEPPSLIEPGRPYEYVIDLWGTSNIFKAGHQIGLHMTSSSFPRWDRNPNTGHPFGSDAQLRVANQQIVHDREHPSHVVLPVIRPG
jgi:putative CocE/NonD family hydrolase